MKRRARGGEATREGGAPGARPTLTALPQVRVREATMADLPVIIALRIALLREHERNPLYARLREDAEERAELLFAAQLRSPHEVILLAERGREAVGILRCVDSPGSPLLYPARYGYVSSVYVVPELRRAGVLRRLLRAGAEWAAERGLTELRLHNAADDPVSNAAWQALGFEVVEHVRLRPVAGLLEDEDDDT